MRWKVLASLFFSEVGWYGRILYVRTLITRTRPRAAERRSSNVWAGSHLQMVESGYNRISECYNWELINNSYLDYFYECSK